MNRQVDDLQLDILLNGTNENPWHTYGLTQNPFPQIAKYEWTARCLVLQSLGGDPIPNVAYIREKLKGFTEEFINLCCDKFRPGKLVRFTVAFPKIVTIKGGLK
jgi:hypothetical protein